MYSINGNNNLVNSATVHGARRRTKFSRKLWLNFPMENFFHVNPHVSSKHNMALLYEIVQIDSNRVELPSYSDESARLGGTSVPVRGFLFMDFFYIYLCFSDFECLLLLKADDLLFL
ncbi:hypothetical protein Pfo_007076 [Paulownia fortunei]|nr:hypothetical protein Pfo_007076 [Paulownia fortunei]